LGVLVLVHEFGHFIVAKFLKVRVETFSIGFGKKIVGMRRGDTEYCISMIPLGGYVKLSGENPEEKRQNERWEFLSRSVGERAAIVIAGPVFNYIIAFLIFSFIFFAGVPTLTAKIGEVKKGYPGVAAGLRPGDRIVFVDGKTVQWWDELSALIHDKTDGTAVVLTVQRFHETFEIIVVPTVEVTNTLFGDAIKIGLVGIAPSEETKVLRYGLGMSCAKGAEHIVTLTKLTFLAFYRMSTGKMSVRDSIAGPVVIFKITGQAARLGFSALLQIMAGLSVSLAIINLFPVPVLDGGHLLFLMIEKLRGKALSVNVQEFAMRIGFSVLVVLMICVFYNDLDRVGFFEKFMLLFKGKQ
jgi:regulator of sigma E protease